MEKLAIREDYTVAYGRPESEKERRAIQGARARRLAAIMAPATAASGAITGLSHSGKGALLGAGIGGLTGLALSGLPYLMPTEHVSVMKDPSGAHRSMFERAITPDVYEGPEGEKRTPIL